MTEESLRKEATNTIQWKCTPMIDRPIFVHGYIIGAKSREERIEKYLVKNVELQEEIIRLKSELEKFKVKKKVEEVE